MGLLDDAIREHLELKRRRGVDPGELAHEERAALEPVFPAESPDAVAPEEEAASHDELDGVGTLQEERSTPPAQEEPPVYEEPPSAAREEIPGVGQETAELDMEAVLAADAPEPQGGSGAQPFAARPPAEQPGGDGRAGSEEPLDWESPAEQAGEGPPQQIPGQERFSLE
jgi:hypothetical protein